MYICVNNKESRYLFGEEQAAGSCQFQYLNYCKLDTRMEKQNDLIFHNI